MFISKLDGVAHLIADAPHANSNTMHIRLVCQAKKIFGVRSIWLVGQNHFKFWTNSAI